MWEETILVTTGNIKQAAETSTLIPGRLRPLARLRITSGSMPSQR